MKVLLVVDVQNDFCPGGSLAVSEGDKVVPVINELIERGDYDLIVATKDWHPAAHKSFAANHKGGQLFSQIDLNGLPQTLWPAHCIQGTEGADFHPGLNSAAIQKIIKKGTNPELDSYSGFFDNARRQSTDLAQYLDAQAGMFGVDREQVELHVVGLATDYCIKATAIDAAQLGYDSSIIIEACRAVNIDPKDEDKALREMLANGVQIISAKEIIADRPRNLQRQIQINP